MSNGSRTQTPFTQWQTANIPYSSDKNIHQQIETYAYLVERRQVGYYKTNQRVHTVHT